MSRAEYPWAILREICSRSSTFNSGNLLTAPLPIARRIRRILDLLLFSWAVWQCRAQAAAGEHGHGDEGFGCVESVGAFGQCSYCLLYTSDAADEEDSVDLGGRRIIKKK